MVGGYAFSPQGEKAIMPKSLHCVDMKRLAKVPHPKRLTA